VVPWERGVDGAGKMEGRGITRELLSHLQWEGRHLREQRDVLLKERECIVRNDLDGLLECIKAKETLLLKGKILEESREALRERLKALAGEGRSLFEVILSEAQNEEREGLLRSREELRELAGQVSHLSEGNGYLLRSALGRIEGAIAILSGFDPSSSRYTSLGALEAEGDQGARLSQEV
jgi:flagellar biosynthesis/type III secretory pathway chaperone